MKSVSARDAKYGFGRLIDLARAAPISVAKHGRPGRCRHGGGGVRAREGPRGTQRSGDAERLREGGSPQMKEAAARIKINKLLEAAGVSSPTQQVRPTSDWSPASRSRLKTSS